MMPRAAKALVCLLLASVIPHVSSMQIRKVFTRRAATAALVSTIAARDVGVVAASNAQDAPAAPAFYKNAATEDDIGTRPVIFGVPAGLLYFGFAASVQISLLLKGKQSVMYKNGTVYKAGKEVVQPFKYSSDAAAKAAMLASKANNSSKRD